MDYLRLEGLGTSPREWLLDIEFNGLVSFGQPSGYLKTDVLDTQISPIIGACGVVSYQANLHGFATDAATSSMLVQPRYHRSKNLVHQIPRGHVETAQQRRNCFAGNPTVALALPDVVPYIHRSRG
jgi:hypothetical protein